MASLFIARRVDTVVVVKLGLKSNRFEALRTNIILKDVVAVKKERPCLYLAVKTRQECPE